MIPPRLVERGHIHLRHYPDVPWKVVRNGRDDQGAGSGLTKRRKVDHTRHPSFWYRSFLWHRAQGMVGRTNSAPHCRPYSTFVGSEPSLFGFDSGLFVRTLGHGMACGSFTWLRQAHLHAQRLVQFVYVFMCVSLYGTCST